MREVVSRVAQVGTYNVVTTRVQFAHQRATDGGRSMNDFVGGAAWYLAQVRPNSFQIAERNLARQSFPVFCPTQEETRRRAGRFVLVTQPLFPGYLFVSFNPASAAWRAINSTYGVSRLV